VISICALFFTLAIIAVTLQFWSTKVKKTKLGLGDYTTLVAFACITFQFWLDSDFADLKTDIVNCACGNHCCRLMFYTFLLFTG
jgi:hypothetical protein